MRYSPDVVMKENRAVCSDGRGVGEVVQTGQAAREAHVEAPVPQAPVPEEQVQRHQLWLPHPLEEVDGKGGRAAGYCRWKRKVERDVRAGKC